MRPEDGENVLEIFQQGINGGNATFDNVAPTWEAWDTKHFNLCRFVLEDENNEVVGWCALQPISNRDCFKGVAEVSIYLRSAAQGKGLGSMMLQKLILRYSAKQFLKLAIKFYQNMMELEHLYSGIKEMVLTL